MTHAFGLGIEHALHGLAWATGALLVLLAVVFCLVLPYSLFHHYWHRLRLWWTIQRLRRTHTASGRH